MRDDYASQVLGTSDKSVPELGPRAEFNRKHPPVKGLVVPHDFRKTEPQERLRRVTGRDDRRGRRA